MIEQGRYEGGEIRSRAAVEPMNSDQVSAQEREGAEIIFGECSSGRLGMAVDTRSREILHTLAVMVGPEDWQHGLCKSR